MKLTPFAALLVVTLFVSACGGTSAAPTPTPLPTVIADDTVTAEGRLEPIHYANLALSAGGLVSEVFFKEGDPVVAGDVIARLEFANAQSLEEARIQAGRELTDAYKEVRDAQYDFDNYDLPWEFKDMTPAQAVRSSLEKLNVARENFEPYKYRSEKSLILTNREKELQEYRDVAKLYKKQLDDAWEKYRKAIRWMELETRLQSAKTRLAQAQKDFDALHDPAFSEDSAGLRAALANAELRAPFPGVITSLDLKVGEFAASGQSVVAIADTSNWVVKTTDLTEIDVVNVKEGQSVVIKLDALPGKEFDGHILSVSQSYAQKQGDVVYEAAALLVETHPAMRWGMTAEVSFLK